MLHVVYIKKKLCHLTQQHAKATFLRKWEQIHARAVGKFTCSRDILIGRAWQWLIASVVVFTLTWLNTGSAGRFGSGDKNYSDFPRAFQISYSTLSSSRSLIISQIMTSREIQGTFRFFFCPVGVWSFPTSSPLETVHVDTQHMCLLNWWRQLWLSSSAQGRCQACLE